MLGLSIAKGIGSGQVYPLEDPEQRYILGKGDGCALVLVDEQVSREHVALTHRDGQWFVQDLGSRNGTRVNGRRVSEHPISLRDRSLIGAVELVVVEHTPQQEPDRPTQRSDSGTLSMTAGQTILGQSDAIEELREEVARMAPLPTTVLIQGEYGTGKAGIARAIHAASRCRLGPFVHVRCGAIPAERIESELFGLQGGAVTGATEDRAGCLAQANSGTLFLDGVSDLTESAQVTLLHVLEEGRYRPIGATEERHSDVRCLAATRNDLERAVADGVFRQDLYRHLTIARLEVPPLRERPEDIPLLAEHFLPGLAQELGRPALHLSPEAADRLAGHRWPGNIRELRNVLERAAIFATGGTITRTDLQLSERSGVPTGNGFPTLKELEAAHVRQALELAGGNKTRAAKLLGISRTTLYEKLTAMSQS